MNGWLSKRIQERVRNVNIYREEEKKTRTASEDFKSNLEGGFRYVDKTELLIPLLNREHETTFFLRPRRFGKTLTLSMIRYFVEDTRDENLNAENRELFRGLKIMEAGEPYIHQMTSFPVINLTLQTVKGEDFSVAYQILRELVYKCFQGKKYLLDSPALDRTDRFFFERVYLGKDENGQKMSSVDLMNSLKRLTEFLRKDSGKRAVVLIDEYDVPLEKAYTNGYYREMVNIIGPMMQNVLKTNSENLQFAVVTGCLRIAKEGIYTGLNNPDINTVLSVRGGDAIGFTEEETRKLLEDSGAGTFAGQVREWYDGYRFGDTVIYNPWSVIKFIEDKNANPNAPPLAYWASTSENAIIRELAEKADQNTRDMIEQVIQGEEISFRLQDNIVYDELFEKPENVWNVMLSAGYLTATHFDGETIQARIPNKEVHRIYRDQIRDWFRQKVKMFDVHALYHAMEEGNVDRMQEILNEEFLCSMSYYDTTEAFYHGVLLTLMQLNGDYFCESNRESGNGRFDVMARRKVRQDLAFILEVKVSSLTEEMVSDAEKAAAQIEEKKYFMTLQRLRYRRIMTYGIAFCQKTCVICQGKTDGT